MRGIVGGVQAKAAVKREIWKAYGWGLQIPDKGVEPFLSADSNPQERLTDLSSTFRLADLRFPFDLLKASHVYIINIKSKRAL